MTKTAESLAREAQRRLFDREPDGRYEITNAVSNDGGTARVQIFGVIGDWWDGLDASTLAAEITALDAAEIEVHLNSPGGIAFDGIAIRNALVQHDASVHVIVDGLAASAASIIAMAGDKITMAVGSQLMIHDASGICIGQAVDMTKTAEVLDKISNSIADIYAEHAGGTRATWRDVMLAETWYTADEAVAAGLADTVEKTTKPDTAKNAFDLSIFAYAGREKAPAPHMPPARPAEPTTQKEGVAVSDTLSKGLRERLGIADELDEAGLLAALDEALNKQADTVTAGVPAGMTLVEKDVLGDLQAKAALGVQAHERQAADDREAAVQAALGDGRISPARAQHWRDSLKADPGALEVLNGLPKNLVPVEAKGYTGGVAEHSDDDETYTALFGKEA